MTLLKLILSVVFSTVLPWSTFSHSIHMEGKSFLYIRLLKEPEYESVVTYADFKENLLK